MKTRHFNLSFFETKKKKRKEKKREKEKKKERKEKEEDKKRKMEIASESEKVTSNLILHQHSEAKETHSVPKFIPNETKYFKNFLTCLLL